MEKNKFAQKLGAGLTLFIMVISVFSGAISAADRSTNSNDLAIIEGSEIQNAGVGEREDPKPSPHTTSQSQGLGAYSHDSDLLQITVGEQSSSGWYYQYDPVGDPGNFIPSVYGEHYAVATDNWGSVKRSDYDFTVDTYFGSVEAPDTATLHYGNLSLTRQVNPPEGSARSFSITFLLTNIGDSTLENVRFFQGVDYDIKDAGNDYAWYSETSDTVWQNDDNYFKNGFHGSRTSSHHDCNGYTSMWSDMHSGLLNDLDKYPESGTADCGIAIQWDAGDLAPQASWDLTITFYFGEAAGIEANAGPDQNVGRSQPVTFDASGSSSVGNITTYEWDFNNDSVYDVSVGTPIYVYGGWSELGEYVVGLRVTDDAGRNDTDNVKITVVPNVDLIVSNIAFTPTEISDGYIVIFNATVENIGTEALTDDFYVRFEIDGSYIGRQQVSGGLSAGASVHVLQSWVADAGTHTVTVYADRGYYSSENDLIPEANETNNLLSQALPAIPFPDLIIASLLWSPTEGINDGDTVTFTTAVENIGAGNTTSDFYVGFEIDGNHIGSQRVSGLAAGGSTEVSQSWDADAGTHTVKAIVDYYNEITEFNESNNELSQALPEIPFPDLTVTNINWSPPTDIRHGNTVTFTATVENIGAGNTSSNFYVRFTIDDGYIGHQKVSGGLAAGGSTAVNLDWIAFEGNHTVKAIADEYDSVTEYNESNNEKSEVLPPIPQPPQVNVTSPNGGEIWYGVQDITWEATSPDGLDLTIKIELYNGHSYELIADGLPNTGVYHNWDTSRFADGSPVPDSTYYKMRITATDTSGVSGSDLSDNWFTIWNTPIVEVSSAPSSQTTTESVNATHYLTIVNKQPSADTFDLLVDNTDNAAVAELSQGSITLDPWGTGTVTQNITDEASGTYRVTVRAVSQTNASITGEVTIPTYVRDAFTTTVSAPRTQTSIGGILTYDIEIANNQGTSDTLTLNVTGIDESWFSTDSFCYLTAGEIKTIPLEISIPDTASAGEFSLTLQATSSNLGTTKEASAVLNVSTDPVIFDLIPGDDTRTGATEVLFTWTTSVNSTSEVFIKAQGEADYTLVSGDTGIFHAVLVSGLSRNVWYDFYVRSNSTHGSVTSEVRSVFIDNGITFSPRTYEFTIDRDYNQERTITIINTDDEPHEVLLNVSGVPEDLALNFVGEGSMDQIIPLFPGESKEIAIVFHAQDAQAEEYTILFNLTTLGAEEITDFAYLKLHIHFPMIDFTIEELSSDPHTLAKTLKVTNNGDPLTDLSVSANDELSSMVMFQPSIDHAYLGTGESIEFEAMPVLSEGFTGASGTINVSAAGEEQNLSVDFSCSDGKQIFVGQYPNLTINYNAEFENDGLIYTNPPDGAVVDSYEIEGDKMFGIYVAVDVRQGEEPIYDAEVQLRVWTPENETVFSGISDAYGTAIFAVHRPIGCYSYKAELVGYGAVTETRSFTASDEPKFTALLEGIQWTNVSDADSTFDLTAEIPEEIELDSTPFSFTATVDQPLEEGAVAVMSLRPDIEDVPDEVMAFIRSSFFVDIKGTVKDNTLSFSTELVPQGTYTAAIAVYRPTEVRVPIFPMALSLPITVNITEEYLDKPLNYQCQRTVALEAGQYAVMNIEQKAEVVDPHKVINLDFIEAGESEYLFRYYALTDQTMDDTIIIEVKNGSDAVILHEIMPVHLEANVMEYIEFSVPVYDEAGNLIEGYNVTVTAADPVVTLTIIGIAWFAGGVGLSVADRYYPEVGVVKCGVGLANPITGLGSAVTDMGFGAYDWVFQKGNAARDAAGTYGAGTGIAAGKADAINAGNKIAKGNYKSFKLPGKGMGTALGVFGCGVEAYEIYEKYSNDKGDKAGAHITHNSHVRNCINHAPLRTTVRTTSDLDFLCSPVQNVEGIFVTAYFPREVPASYQPFDTIIMLNGHEIGRIEDAVPKGYYTFEADPTWLNYAEAGVAENTITLDVEGMNRGYYVPLEGYKIDILFKKLTRAVCVASQAEADQIVMDLGSVMDHRGDFAVGPADIKFSDLQPSEGEAVTIEATIHNMGSEGEIQVDVQFIDNGVEIGSVCAPYLPEFSSETVSVNWTATGGTHNIQLKVNHDREINESDYTNNEASKTVTVTAPDIGLPEISNPQPPDGSTTSDNTTLISADLADADSGINTTAVRITVDDLDVTQNATVISSRVWYTPELALANDVHSVSVYAEDNKGNNNSLRWSFTVATEKQPPIASFTYSPENPAVNETITFNASNSYDLDGLIVNYEWEFGDEMEATGEIVEHSYSNSGDYTVILRVTDNDSLSNTDIMIVTVSSVALPDLTLSSGDIQFILPSSNSTSSSSSKHTKLRKDIYKVKMAVAAVDVGSKEKMYQGMEIQSASNTINSSWTTSPPTIDGTLDSGEWVDATKINITFHAEDNCSMFVMNDEENLYIAFDVANDTTNDINTQDVTQLGFDGNHDDLIAPYGTYPVYMSGTCVDLWALLRGNSTESKAGWLNMNEAGTDCLMWWTPSNPTGPQVLATGFSDHRIYEYSIPLATALNVSTGDTIGLNVLINDGLGTPDTGDFRTQGVWPSTWDGLCDFTADGDLTLATAPIAEIATLKATIHDIGWTDASGVVVQFFDGDPTASGIQIGSDQTIPSIPAGGTGSAEVSWDITEKVGSHDIYVRIDPNNTITESNENNNQAYRQIAVTGVTCSDPNVTIDYAQTSVTDDPVGEGYDISNAPANVYLTNAKGFDITATGPDGSYLFNITFPSPVSEGFVLYKLPEWAEMPYSKIGSHTIQVQLEITEGVLDPAFILASAAIFDTGPGTYTSISGIHNGTITPNQTITVSKLYTYSCEGTGGHTEYAAFSYTNGTLVAEANWNGYVGDWHNISFNESFVLHENETYNYTIRTGSYPQIHHNKTLTVPDGEITCTKFTDVNGRIYYDWIPAIKLT